MDIVQRRYVDSVPFCDYSIAPVLKVKVIMEEHLSRKHQYTKNFLSDVILRIDFERIEFPSDKIEEIKKSFSDIFPILQKLQNKSITFQIKGGSSTTEESESVLYKLVDKDNPSEKILEFDNTHFAYTEKKYYSHNLFNEIVDRIIKFYNESFENLSLTRVGLRYINQIALNEREPYNLNGIIDNELTTILSFNPQKKPIIRSMNSTEYKIDNETKLLFKYGLFNKNYPSEPINKEFILDYDCYSNVVDNIQDVKEFLDKNNKLLAIYFEASIGDKLRKETLHEESSK